MLDTDELTRGVAFLMEAVRSAPSADNSQPWCFDWDGTILTCRVRRRGGFPVDYHATRLALGTAAENLIWSMQSLGLDMTSWYIGIPKGDGIFAQGSVTGRMNDIELFNTPLWKLRHTNRLPYCSEIDPAIGQQLRDCQVNKVGVRVVTGSGIRKIADWIKQASEIRFQTPEVNKWFAASLRYGSSPEEINDGLHVNTLALPPGGGALLKLMSDWGRMQWLNRIRAYKLFAAIEAANFQKTPLIIAIVGSSDKSAAFDAGRCLQQVWLRVTELGLSAHPYYVVSDLLNRLESGSVPTECMAQALALQANIYADLDRDTTLHCLLRVGKPIGKTQVSGRIPLGRLMCNVSDRS